MYKRKIKRLVRFVRTCIISIIVILAIMISNSDKALVGAMEAYNNRPFNKETIINEQKDYSKSKSLYELIEYRSIDSKVFKNEDGLSELAIYGDAVHYFENGVYKDIDNSLVYDKDNKQYKNVANFYSSTFPEDLKDNKISIEFDNYEISYSVSNIESSDIKTINKIQSHTGEIKELKKVSSGIVYKNIQDSVDLQYTLRGQSIKEDIILNKYIENYQISFVYELKGLTLVNVDNSFYFKNYKNEIVSQFSDFVIYDNEGNGTNDIKLIQKNIDDSKYEITIVPDNKFLKEASYPVVIDPTINLTDKGLTIQNKYISRDNQTQTYYTYENPGSLWIQRYDYGRYFKETYIGFSNIQNALSSIKSIDSVILELSVQSSARFYSACRVSASEVLNYSYSQITPTSSLELEHSDIVTYNKGSGQLKLDLTNTIYKWIDESVSSRTLKIQGIDNTYNSEYEISFYGMSTPTTFLRPTLKIYYDDQIGLVPYQDFSSFESSAGTLFVNNHTLQPTFIHIDYDYESENSSFSIKHVYNNSRNNIVNYGFGTNWNLNINKEFVYNTTGTKYLINSDGYIKNFTTDIQTSGISIDGSEDTYSFSNIDATEYYGRIKNSDGSETDLSPQDNSVIFVTTKDNLRYEFRKFLYSTNYRLVKVYKMSTIGEIIDNYITITYLKNSYGFWIDTINLFSYNYTSLSFDQLITAELEYESSYLNYIYIKKRNINDQFSLIQYFDYNYSATKLDNIKSFYNYEIDEVKTEDNTIYYNYDSKYNLLTANKTNNDGLTITYTISNGVKSVEHNSGTLLLDKVSFKSRGSSTIITDRKGNETEKKFDEHGRYIGSTNSLGIINKISYYENETGSINYNNIHCRE